KQKQSVKRQS
ncbi:IgA-specific serine endopeptidase autotransporter precursor, partial [Haemophilus influenzae]